MFRRKSEIIGYAIAASDGVVGTVTDFLFDDANWFVRWVVVDTGNWLSGRKVLLHPSALAQVANAAQFSVKLTMQQVKDSPNTGTAPSVTRQMETNMYDYYAWGPPYWTSPLYMGGYGFYVDGHGYMGGAATTAASERAGQQDEDIARNRSDDGDPHLRSAQSVTGYHIHASDGEIGHVEDFLVEDSDWSIHYLVVDTKNWWPGKNVLVSPWSATEINWKSKLVNLDVDQQTVKNSPEYNASTVVDPAYENNHRNHYREARSGIQP